MPTLAKTSKLNPFLWFGYLFLLFSLVLLLRIFWEPVKLETSFKLTQSGVVPLPTLSPVNTDFSLLIRKINAVAPIVASVDPYDSWEYQKALTRGIAQAQGTGLPGQGKNIFLFAHSSANPLEASRFNSVFYLLHRLETGDQIEVWYQKEQYFYSVSGKNFVSPDKVEYLSSHASGEQLTLMTCWPPGTTLKRLIITAKSI